MCLVSPERWGQVRAVFDAAVERPAAEAEEFLQRECAGDPQLYSEVRRMLEEHRREGFLDHPPALARFQPGALVSGRYRVVRPLGHGGMGEVYEAEDTELHEPVALKTLLPEIANDSRMIGRFKREIQLARRIGHPNVCRVFDLARDPADASSPEAVLFLTMEFLPGETLAGRLARAGRFAPGEALPLLAQMAGALDAAHRAGIIHRDFKPSNVMLAPGERGAVVTDFGLARTIEISTETTATATGHLVGTVDYMAPELFTGSASSPASDQYALGLVAYKMVTGALPFESDSPLAAVVRRAGQTLPPARTRVPELAPAWDAALARALDPNPARRFASCAAFIAGLRGEDRSVTLSLPRFSRRRTAGLVGIAAVLLAAPFGWRAWERAKARPSAEAQALYDQGAADLHAGAYFAATKSLQQAIAAAPHFALAHARLAEGWNGLDLSEKAAEEMLLARRQDLSLLPGPDRLQLEAIDLTLTREFAAAAAKYEELIRSGGGGEAYVDLGRAYDNAGKPDKAIDAYGRATQAARPSAAAWLALGVLYNRTGAAAKGDDAFQHAEQLYQTGNDLEGLTELAFQRGATASARDQFEVASRYLERALQTALLAGNVHEEVRAKLSLSTNAYRAGEAAQAERYAREALDAARANQIGALAVRGIISLGLAYSRKGDPATAEKYDLEALGLARAANAQRLVAYSLLVLAVQHNSAARYADSEREAAEALSYYEANRFAIETFQCLTLLGRARLRGADDMKGALAFFQRAADAAQKSGDRASAALAEESAGAALAAVQRYPEAMLHFQKEAELSTTEERKAYANRYLGEALGIMGRYADAGDALQTAQAASGRFPSLKLLLLHTRARIELSREHFSEAKALAGEALASAAAADRRLDSELTGALGLALAGLGDVSGGLRRCRESLDDAVKLGEAPVLIRARADLAQVLTRAGDRAGVLKLLKDNQPEEGRYPEVRWRVLALMAQADSQYSTPARDALRQLGQLWGETAWRQYLARPDIDKLSRPLFPSVRAKQQ